MSSEHPQVSWLLFLRKWRPLRANLLVLEKTEWKPSPRNSRSKRGVKRRSSDEGNRKQRARSRRVRVSQGLFGGRSKEERR